jgi:hypothetical protein
VAMAAMKSIARRATHSRPTPAGAIRW